MSNGGPPNKWTKLRVSATIDPLASSSDMVLGKLNDLANHGYDISAATTVACSDGTYIFLGSYAEDVDEEAG